MAQFGCRDILKRNNSCFSVLVYETQHFALQMHSECLIPLFVIWTESKGLSHYSPPLPSLVVRQPIAPPITVNIP